jgi:hypothetical protein
MRTVSTARLVKAATVVAVGGVAATVAFASPVSADDPPSSSSVPRPTSSCTPGFWKNHEDSWDDTGLAPDELATSVFTGIAGFELDEETLLESLGGGGGSGDDGAAEILLRAAVAALLNASTPDSGFSMTTDELVAAVNVALAADRDAMLALADELDQLNNAGDCLVGGADTPEDVAGQAGASSVELLVGPPSEVPAGPPNGVPVGPLDGVPAGPPDGVPAGPPEGVPAGPPAG